MFLAPNLHASEKGARLEQKIFNRILRGVTRHHEPYRVYFYGKTPPAGLRENPKIHLSHTPESAEVIIIGSTRFSRSLAAIKKPALTLDYDLLRRYPYAVGAYFWQKGRPNIVMIRSRLEKVGIVLPPDFDRFIDNTIW